MVYTLCPVGVNPRRFWRRKAALTAQNPRRHAAGKPFHAFLTGWLGRASPRSDSGEMGYLRREVERRVERARFSAWRPRSSLRGWFPRLPWVREALLWKSGPQTFPGEMEAVNLPRSRYLQVSNEAPAVKGGAATERSEAPLTGEGSAVARLPSGSGRAPLPSRSACR
jgi:hypothetical protein